MRIVFYSIVLNHHQAPVADTFYEILGDDYVFVEIENFGDLKGSIDDFSRRPYLLQAWKSDLQWQSALDLARTADVCVFSGVQSLVFQKERMKVGLLSFDMSERWLKRGILNVFSPAVFKMWLSYHWGSWRKKPLYKLCCSAFAAGDQYRLGTFRGKCYKWGYFTRMEKFDVETTSDVSTSNITPLMWCSRYLMLKHPELPILMAYRLKVKGYRFVLDMYGSGEYETQAKELVKSLGLEDVIHFMGNKPNDELMREMRKHSIFLFTSDRNEGWGAVANESMSNGCALVSSDAIGSTPYLVKEGETGLSFKSPRVNSSFGNPDNEALDSLCEKVEYLICHPQKQKQIRITARKQMEEVWSPKNAARSLLALIENLKSNKGIPIKEGPCSKA